MSRFRQTPRTRTGSSDRKSQRKRIGSDRSAADEGRNAVSPRNQQQYNGATPKNRLDSGPAQQEPQPRQTPKVRAPPLLQKVQGHPQLQQQQQSATETPGLPANKRLTMDLLYKKTANARQDDDGEEDRMEMKQKPSLSSLIQQDSIDQPERDINANLQKTRCPPPALPDLSQLALADAAGNAAAANESPLSPPANGRQSKGSIGAVHSLAERYTPSDNQQPQTTPQQPDEDEGAAANPFANALARAKKGMDKKMAAREPVDNRKESEIQWEQAMQNWRERPLIINDLDFTELDDGDDQDPVRLAMMAGGSSASPSSGGYINPYTGVGSFGGGGPPPPPAFGGVPPPPPPGGGLGVPPPPRLSPSPVPANRAPSPNPQSQQQQQQQQQNHKTVKLFWKEAQVQPLPGVLDKKGVFWEKVKPVDIDVEKLNQLFETKTKDVVAKVSRLRWLLVQGIRGRSGDPLHGLQISAERERVSYPGLIPVICKVH